MTRRLISTGSPFEKTAGYSRAVVDGDLVFVSGTTGYDYATMTMPESVEQQTRNAFATIEKALKEAGAGFADVVQTRYYLTDAAAAPDLFMSPARSSARSVPRTRPWSARSSSPR